MFFFKRKRETVDDRPKDLQKLRNAIESLGLIDELEKHVVYGSPDVRTQVQKFTIYPMKGSLKEISLSRVFRVEEFEELYRVSGGPRLARVLDVPEERIDDL